MVFWVAGCTLRCVGCIVPELFTRGAGSEFTVNSILDIVNKRSGDIDGITFSGGEPLQQPVPLQFILSALSGKYDLMLYTGYLYHELNQEQKNCYDLCDLVVEGRFVDEQKGNYLWRGSSEQQFASPTGKYNNIIPELYKKPSAGLQIYRKQDKVFIYGIPREDGYPNFK